MGDANTALSEQDARYLLRRTGFEVKESKVESLTGRTRGQAVDGIVRGRGSSFRPFVHWNIQDGDIEREMHDSWLNYMLKTGRQFQEKMVLFWHDHFACNQVSVLNLVFMAEQNRLLRRHSIGNRSGQSFKDFVKAINKDAAMMEFLDTVRNSKTKPNENYPRELQELFTLGVKDLAGVSNYTQADIVQIARAFSGWRTYKDTEDGHKYGEAHLSTGSHDFGTPKIIYTTVGGFGGSGRDITLGGTSTGEGEIDTVIDIIFDHKDSQGKNTVARHIAKKLLDYLAHPGADSTTIDEVISASNFDGLASAATGFQLNPLLKAILTHDFFYDGVGQPQAIKCPVDYVVSALRTLKIKLAYTKFERQLNVSGGPENETVKLKYYHIFKDGNTSLRTRLDRMGQMLFEPPSVFGWDWETSWVNSGTLLARYDFAVQLAEARPGSEDPYNSQCLRTEGLLNFAELTDAGLIVDAVTKLLGVHDRFPVASTERTALMTYLTDNGTVTPDLNSPTYKNKKLHGLISLVIESPAYQTF